MEGRKAVISIPSETKFPSTGWKRAQRCIGAAMSALLLGVMVAPMPVKAAMVTLTFEGVGDYPSPVADFYNGDGPNNYGIAFSDDALGLVDDDAGGTGGFENEPSSSTVVFFSGDSTGFTVDVAAGFQTAFSFWYAAAADGSVEIFDGFGDSLVPSTALTAQSQATCNGELCVWTFVEFLFNGTAKSIVFSGSANKIAFDNMSFGSNGTPVPLPAAAWLLLSGLAGLGYVGRRKVAV